MKPILIKNGRVITASEDYVADILCEGETIRSIGTSLAVDPGVEIHDASGLLVLPGGVDAHTHLDWEFGAARTVDTFASGTKAAAFGGTTTIVDFCNQGSATPLAALEEWRGRAGTASVDVGAHLIINRVSDEALRDVRTLIEGEGVTSFKVFMAYPNGLMLDDGEIFRVMRVTAEHGGIVCLHAENGPVIQVLVDEALAAGNRSPNFHEITRPSQMEAEAVQRGITIANLVGAVTYFVHLSASASVRAVAHARQLGQPVYAETCPHYLFLTREEYDRPGFDAARFVMTPPLRTRNDQDALWAGLRTGALSVVSTDHCPFCMAEQPYGMLFSKQQGRDDFSKIPNGAPGIETRLSLVFDGGVRTGQISLNRFVELMSTAPAKLFGLYPQKGTIAPGSDADLVLFDPNEAWTIRAAEHHSRVDYSLFEGRRLSGQVKKVFLRGQLIVDGTSWNGRDGMGRFLRRTPVSPGLVR